MRQLCPDIPGKHILLHTKELEALAAFDLAPSAVVEGGRPAPSHPPRWAKPLRLHPRQGAGPVAGQSAEHMPPHVQPISPAQK